MYIPVFLIALYGTGWSRLVWFPPPLPTALFGTVQFALGLDADGSLITCMIIIN